MSLEELEAVKQAIRERSEELEQQRRRHSPPRFVIVRRGKKSEQLGALHSHYKDLEPATFPRGAWVWVWFASPQRWAFNASDREVLRDATADDLVFWRCDAEAQKGAP